MTASGPEAAATAGVEELADSDVGRYELATHTARYLLDLDARRLLRIPRSAPVVPGPGAAPLEPVTVVRLFDLDHGWVELLALEHCVRGHEMRLRAVIDGQAQPWRATAVLRIKRLPASAW